MNDDIQAAMLEVNELQTKMIAIAEEIAAEEDTDVILAKSKEAQELGEVLQEKAQKLGDMLTKQQAEYPKTTGDITIELTPWQREAIKEETDLDMETIVLRDRPVFFNEIIPSLDPDTVEVWALDEARRMRAEIDAHEEAKANFHSMLRELEANDNPDFQIELEKQKQDPNGLGGLIDMYGEPPPLPAPNED